ncbi:MAG: hypothetical protein ACREDA_05305, partial [Methylocella sp.]
MKPALESQGTPTRIWARRGTRPRIKRERRFTWAKPAKGSGKRSLSAEQSLPKRLRRYGPRRATRSAPSELVEDCPARGIGAALV